MARRLSAVMVAAAPPAEVVTPAAPTRPRDRFLDLVRAVSISRVVVIHLIGRSGFSFWPAPTFVAPGMPIVFFVSGALVRKTLGRRADGTRRSTIDYWRATFRRLLLPFWAYYSVVVTASVIGDLTHDEARWSLDWGRLALGATGFAIPSASREMRHHTGHLWFMAAFLGLTVLAPMLVRLHERIGLGVLLVPLAGFAWAEWAIAGGTELPNEVYKFATFAVPYVAGFWYTRRSFGRIPPWAFGVAAVALGAVAWWYDGIRPGAVNPSGIKHLLVGGAWFALALAFAPRLRVVAERYRHVIDRISRRTFTIFLWGWTTSILAWDLTEGVVDGVWARRCVYYALALGLLAAAVALFGWVEDVAAGRPARPPWRRHSSIDPAAVPVS